VSQLAGGCQRFLLIFFPNPERGVPALPLETWGALAGTTSRAGGPPFQLIFLFRVQNVGAPFLAFFARAGSIRACTHGSSQR
jgi:hypothetical protein